MSAPKNILVVEDEVLIALSIEDTLAERGHRVQSAASVTQAAAILSGDTMDLVILDYHLQHGTSEELMRYLNDRHIPFILCSGTAGLDELGEAFSTTTFLPKPFTTDLLLDAVAAVAKERVQ